MANKPSLENELSELAAETRRADATAFLVEGRVIRRVIREQYPYSRLLVRIPHSKVYVARREQLRGIVHPDELGLPSADEIPPRVILIEQPTDRQIERMTRAALQLRNWRLLFHGQIDRAIREEVESGGLSAPEIRRYIDELGQVAFDEIHAVLGREELLLDPSDPTEAWCEFVAVYHEFHYFAPHSIPTWFPSLRDREVASLLPDLQTATLIEESRLDGAAAAAFELEESETAGESAEIASFAQVRSAPRRFRRHRRRAHNAAVRGNTVSAAIQAARAVTLAPDSDVDEAREQALAEIDRLVSRLQTALEFGDDEAVEWQRALRQLLAESLHGFWNSDKKLLYDLQKVCSAHERVTYTVDLTKWIVSRGRRQIKRPLPNQSEVMMSKYLRSAASRLPYIRLSGRSRDQLSSLIRSAAHSAEHQMRHRLEPIVRKTLHTVGFEPADIPDRVAFNKVTAECLDCIAHRGYLTMGYLRDAVSRNNLKLPDLSSVREVIGGDRLLRADDLFDETLDGVYHRGEFYLRWLQTLSSLAFGTRTGRFATQFLAIPFGGAFLIVEGVNHILHHIVHRTSSSIYGTPVAVLLVGLVLMCLMHLHRFRRFLVGNTVRVLRFVKRVFLDTPLRLLQLPQLRRLFRSTPMRMLRRYVLTPGLVTLVGCYLLPLPFGSQPPPWQLSVTLFVLFSAMLNSRVGRDVEELTVEWTSNRWYQLRAHVFVALFEWIWELFKKLLEFLERFLYAIDEWLRFRSGESVVTLGLKAVLGVVWSFIVFLVRIYVNLLIEPQVNPIKHFPVVTVSHKVILPLTPQLVVFMGEALEPFVGSVLADSIAVATVFLLPGVFGFLVWELKENWRLYEANRAQNLKPVIVGSHGETMLRLLKPGFHSGTLPKLYRRLRRLDRKAPSFRRSVRAKALYDQLHHYEEAIRHHAERELLGYLYESRTWQDDLLGVAQVEATSNSIGFLLTHSDHPETPARLVFQEQSGWLVAGLPEPGWVDALDPDRQIEFIGSLAGFYKVGGVDLVREQIRHCLEQPGLAYDITEEGLKVWPGETFRMEFVYDLTRRPVLTPRPSNAGRRAGLPVINADSLLLSAQNVEWSAWVRFWSDPQGDVERPLRHCVLLDARTPQMS